MRPDLKIISSRVYRGPNVWHYEPAIQLVVDLGELEDYPDQQDPRLHRGTAGAPARPGQPQLQPRPPRWLRRTAERGHLARPRRRARGPAAAAGGRPRHAAGQDPRGQGPAGTLQRDLRLHRRVGRPGRGRTGRTAGQRPGQPRSGVRLRCRAGDLHRARRADRVRPLDPGAGRRGGESRHPVHPAEHRVPGPARPGRAPEADPRDHDLGDLLDRGRHREQQGAHLGPARRCGPAGATLAVRADDRAGGPGSPPGSAIRSW